MAVRTAIVEDCAQDFFCAALYGFWFTPASGEASLDSAGSIPPSDLMPNQKQELQMQFLFFYTPFMPNTAPTVLKIIFQSTQKLRS